MFNFFTTPLIKLVFLIFSLNITFVQSVRTILRKPNNDDNNLYTNFNKRLSAISNYAKNQMDEVSAPYLDQLFKTNNEIINELNSKKQEKLQPKKTRKFYDRYDNFNDETDSEAKDDGSEKVNRNLHRLFQMLGKPKNVNNNNVKQQPEQLINLSRDQEEKYDVDSGNKDDADDDDDDNNNDDTYPADDDSSSRDEANIEETPIELPEIKTKGKSGPSDKDVAKWVKENPEKFQTFVHTMYVVKNKDKQKIQNEISCLIFCNRVNAEGDMVDDDDGERCVCRSKKKRRKITNENSNVVRRKNEIPTSLLSSSSTSSASSSSSSSSSSLPAEQETPFMSSENLLNNYEKNNKNNNKEDKNQMDENIFNGNLIDPSDVTVRKRRDESVVSQENIDESIKSVESLLRVPKCDACSQLLDTQCNATVVLDRVLEELDAIKQERDKVDLNCSDGKPCNITGSWNSQIIGMQFNLNTSCGTEHELLISIAEHYPPKRACMMDTNWTLVGYALHLNGGPFYMAATRSKEEVMATFTGMCRICSGAETIFGTWNFIRPAKDCRDLLMAVDVRRDIFHKSSLHAKVLEKQKQIQEKKEASSESEEAEKS